MTRVLGTASAATEEDPFGPGDPLEAARLVRRALAVAGRRATDVDGLAMVTDRAPKPAALARFVRRALGPHGADVPAIGRAGPCDHDARLTLATEMAGDRVHRGVAIAIALGPDGLATVACIGGDR